MEKTHATWQVRHENEDLLLGVWQWDDTLDENVDVNDICIIYVPWVSGGWVVKSDLDGCVAWIIVDEEWRQ